ncbi:MAG: DUF2240 family protein [Candidatus Thermoplasmatota archaeon]|nr:DUF2240 family protein [Candidatus Thermoplasmatota archaeon]
MFTEEQIILAFIFNRSGKTALSPSDIYFPLSLELNWLTTTEAKDFVNHCQQHSLLKKTPEGLIPTFDLHTVEIPRGFQPTKKYTSQSIEKTSSAHKTTYQRILEHIHNHTELSIKELDKELNELSQEKNIHNILAAVLYAKKHNVELPVTSKDIEQTILKEYLFS